MGKKKVKIFIFCAGLNKRLESEKPKCLLSLNGETILDRQIRFFYSKDFRDITIVVAELYPQMMEAIINHIQSRYPDIKFLKLNFQKRGCEKTWTLMNYLSLFENSFIFLGDVVFNSKAFNQIINISKRFKDGIKFIGRGWEIYALIIRDTKKLINLSNPFTFTFYEPINRMGKRETVSWENAHLFKLYYWLLGKGGKRQFTPTAFIEDVDTLRKYKYVRKVVERDYIGD